MPVVFRQGPYRFYFFSHEPNEPPHVHVDREGFSVKFWISPVALAGNIGFSPKELRRIQALVIANRNRIQEAWDGYFGSAG